MAHISFAIPLSIGELVNETDDQYYVRNLTGVKEMSSSLKAAQMCFRDEGAEYILENFDVYYSTLHYADKLNFEVVHGAYEVLHKAVKEFSKSLAAVFCDDIENLSEEFKMKYFNVMKMLLYIYINFVTFIEQRNESTRTQSITVKGKGRKRDLAEADKFNCDRLGAIVTLHNVVQQDVKIFFDPPVVDEIFINMISDVGYKFLETQTIKSEKELRKEIFQFLGTLLKDYNHGMTFVIRIVQIIKMHEHLTHCIPEGVQQLVETYNCKSLVRDLVREITEWQVDEQYADSSGTRHCSTVLSQMAVLMPNLMIPEVLYLNRYLCHDSYVLRNSVLSVIVEVVLIALTKQNLNDEEKESRDDFLALLEEHILDCAAQVRSKVFQHWARLQKENAVPMKIQLRILEKAIFHLRDKGAMARKAAAGLVTTFLEHNVYGANLKMEPLIKDRDEKTEELRIVRAEIEGIDLQKLKDAEAQWMNIQDDIRAAITKALKESAETEDSEDDGSDKEETDEIPEEDFPKTIKEKVTKGLYTEAFQLCKKIGTKSTGFKQLQDTIEASEEVDLYLTMMCTFFIDARGHAAEAASRIPSGERLASNEENIKKLEALEYNVDYLNDSISFLKLIDSSIKPMTDLLESVSINDVQEAIAFFIAAYKFNIDNALVGVLEILKIMQRPEQDRRELAVQALKTIYLTTDSKSLNDHTDIITRRLIDLLESIPSDNFKDMSAIISEWTAKGILDNSIIDTLWQYCTKRIDVTDDMSRAALGLLTMAAQGRRTIITRNIKLVSSIAFGDRGLKDVLLATQACKILSVAGMEKQDITDPNPPFKIKATDPVWKEVCDIVVTYFDKKVKFVNNLISEAIDFIYRLCGSPIRICEELTKTCLNKLVDKIENEEIESYLLIRFCTLLGAVSIRHLNFLDDIVYKELKRRNYIRDEKKNQKKGDKDAARKSIRMGASNKAKQNMTNQASTDNLDESVMEGAQAEDTDAEFICDVLENNTVSMNTTLGKLAQIVIKICSNPAMYNDEHVQCSAVIALLRFMLISNTFCANNIQLIFTILEKSNFEDVKINILVHCPDLMEKRPNIIEPFTTNLYLRLKDDSIRVRKTSLFMLSNMILRDMIRVQGHISEIARCVVDDDAAISDMSRNFFVASAHKANYLYNVLPDIFSHLVESMEQEPFRKIISFLFGLIDKNKQMENLVERFCAKFRVTDKEDVARNIAFTLSLINYNQCGLRKLVDNFLTYKHFVHVEEIYVIFKGIIASCSKPTSKSEQKELATELDNKIKQVFELTEGVEAPELPKAGFKKPRVPQKKRAGKKKKKDSDDSGSDQEFQESPVKSKRTTRKRTTVGRKNVNNSDSDTD